MQKLADISLFESLGHCTLSSLFVFNDGVALEDRDTEVIGDDEVDLYGDLCDEDTVVVDDGPEDQPESELDGIKYKDFEGVWPSLRWFNGPKGFADVFVKTYDEYMQLPDKDQRTVKRFIVTQGRDESMLFGKGLSRNTYRIGVVLEEVYDILRNMSQKQQERIMEYISSSKRKLNR